MASVNGTQLNKSLDLADDVLGLLLVELSPKKDGKGLRLGFTVEEEAALFVKHDLVDPWLTEVVQAELQRQQKPFESVQFTDESGGIYQS